MCLAVPMKLVKINDDLGIVELDGVQREISLQLLNDIKIGEYVLIHAGFAIQKLNEEEAEKTLSVLREISSLDESN